MCGILATRGKGNNYYIQHRGQDCSTVLEADGMQFVHNLLSVTGAPRPQPYVDGDVVCLFNGEIYNHAYTVSDGEVILPLYREHGERFAQYLDGEFAVAIYDRGRDRVLFATDAFATKPLFINAALECASYASGIEAAEAVPANSTLVFEGGELRRRLCSHEFVWGRHHKDSYQDWIEAFWQSVLTRARPGCFYGLSSGYDSGAINLVLTEAGVESKAYSMVRGEDAEVLAQRLARTPDHLAFALSMEQIRGIQAHMQEHTEPFQYRIFRDGDWQVSELFADPAAISMSAICATAQQEGRRVYLSGQGADEILSDYSLVPQQSQFRGRFPARLDGPWLNFHSSCMSSYLGKEERIAGTFNIETRYPFLDKGVVQEFLYLAPELKNRDYKAPLAALMDAFGYPYEAAAKRGFGV